MSSSTVLDIEVKSKDELTNKQAARNIRAQLLSKKLPAGSQSSQDTKERESGILSVIEYKLPATDSAPIVVGVIVKDRPSIDAVKTDLTLDQLKDVANEVIATKANKKRKISI